MLSMRSSTKFIIKIPSNTGFNLQSCHVGALLHSTHSCAIILLETRNCSRNQNNFMFEVGLEPHFDNPLMITSLKEFSARR
jgi:hypothetical protein